MGKNKEILQIWLDGDVIKGNFHKRKQMLSQKDVQKVLTELFKQKEISFSVDISKDIIIAEYSDIYLYIFNASFLKNFEIFKEYFASRLKLGELSRIKQLEASHNQAKNDTSYPDDYAVTLLEKAKQRRLQLQTLEEQEKIENIDLAIDILRNGQKKKNVEAQPLKINRENKYSGKLNLKVVAGFAVAAALTVGGICYAISVSQPDIDDYSSDDEMESLETTSEKPNIESDFIFQPAIDLSEQFPIDESEISDNEDTASTMLSYPDLSYDEKAIITKNKYGDLIEKYAKKCGLDPNLVMGIATQESGNHEFGLRNGSLGGLMQIEISYWDGKEIEYYDFEDQELSLIKISREAIQNVENNLLVACAILQSELRTFNYNILLSTQSYNMGYDNMSKVLDKASKETGIPKTKLINDHNCLEWLNYTDFVDAGDPDYLNNVLRYTGYGYDFYDLSCTKENGDVVTVTTSPIVTEQKVI